MEERDNWLEDSEWEDYIHEMAELSTYYLALNSDFEPLNEPKVREAIDYAIDSEQITESLFPHYVPANDAIPKGLPGGTDLKIKFDPARAKELLAEAGYPDGFDLELWVNDGDNPVRVGGVIQAMLKQVGIDVELVKNDWSVFYSAVQEGKTPSYYLSWWSDYADPFNFLKALYYGGENRIGYDNPVVNELIDEMARTTDEEERVHISEKIIDTVNEEDPYVFLHHTSSTTIKQPWGKGEVYHQMYTADKLLTWWIDEEIKEEEQ